MATSCSEPPGLTFPRHKYSPDKCLAQHGKGVFSGHSSRDGSEILDRDQILKKFPAFREGEELPEDFVGFLSPRETAGVLDLRAALRAFRTGIRYFGGLGAVVEHVNKDGSKTQKFEEYGDLRTGILWNSTSRRVLLL